MRVLDNFQKIGYDAGRSRICLEKGAMAPRNTLGYVTIMLRSCYEAVSGQIRDDFRDDFRMDSNSLVLEIWTICFFALIEK